MVKLFTYGSLKRGFSRSDILTRNKATFISVARTQPNFRLYDLGSFPGMISVEKEGLSIVGELWEIPDGLVEYLDMIEGHPRFYKRTMIKLDDGQEVLAYLLQMPCDGLPDCGQEYT